MSSVAAVSRPNCGQGAYLFFVEPYNKSYECFKKVIDCTEEGPNLFGRVAYLVASILLLVPIINVIAFAVLRVCEDEGLVGSSPQRLKPTQYEIRAQWLELCAKDRDPEVLEALKLAAFKRALIGTIELAQNRAAMNPDVIALGRFDGIVAHLFFPPDADNFYFTDEEVEEIMQQVQKVLTQSPEILQKAAHRRRRRDAEAELPPLPHDAREILTEAHLQFLLTLTENETACLSARLTTALDTHIATARFQNILSHIPFKHRETPGDGNCFLWACVLGQALANGETVARHEVRTKFDEQMVALRADMVVRFRQRLNDPEFRREFLNYIFENKRDFEALLPKVDPETLEALPENERAAAQSAFLQQRREELCIAAEVPEAMIEGYIGREATAEGDERIVGILEQRGSWNGEFEAQLAADCLADRAGRPIVIFKNGRYFTIAGAGHLTSGAKPIFVNHVNGNHWITLDPYGRME